MTAYIIRRVIAAFLLLFVVSLVTFVIFFEVPKFAGESTSQLAAQYVGRDPSPEAIAAVEKNLGFDQPLLVQYWHFISRIFVGANFKYGPDASYCHVPCFGYSFKTHLEVWPDITSRLPVTLSLALGAAVIWVISGVIVGVISALRPGSIWDRFSMTIALAGVSLPVFFTGLLAKSLFVYNGVHLEGHHLRPLHDGSRAMGIQSDIAVDHAGVPLCRVVRPAHARRHARDDERGLHPNGPGEGIA